jgi:phosphomannomutase/phosphoglucomutase
MPEKKSLFGTSGIRGPADTLFTEQFCFDIGRTFVKFLEKYYKTGPIAVGIDPRDSSPRIKKQLFKGLATTNLELFDEGIAPVPSMNWLIKNTEIIAGIIVTGSHISPELNGVKFYAHDEEVSAEDQKNIESLYKELKEKEKLPSLEAKTKQESRARDLYSKMLFEMIRDPLPKWKVAVDCANGSQSIVVPALLRKLGLDVVEVNCDTEKDFIARDTDTDDKAEVEELKKVVVKENCDFGIAYDGDGDRVIFIDEKGQFVQGEYSCSLIAKDSPGDTVITPISSSQVVDTIGKKIIRTKVGSPYVVGKMKEHKAPFGFEPNGGAISAEIMYTRDGGSTTMKILTLYSKFDGNFSSMIAQLPKFYMLRTKVDYKWELKGKILEEAKKRFKGIKVEEIDGLKIWVDDQSWILFRSSQNAPEFRVFAESAVEDKAKTLLDDGIKFVKEIIGNNE